MQSVYVLAAGPKISMPYQDHKQMLFQRTNITCNSLRINERGRQSGIEEVWRTWRRLTLPGGYPPSTIGADGLNCRVRDETGCTPVASDTKHRHTCTMPRHPPYVRKCGAHTDEDETRPVALFKNASFPTKRGSSGKALDH